MTIEEFQPDKPGHLTTIVRRMSGSARIVRNGAANLVGRLPASVKATQAGAQATTSALQKLPDTTLRSLAASSAGLGAGLYLAGKNRLLVALGVVPAIVVGAAIALRPHKTVAPPKSSI
jgi:hypothetical protein